MKLKRLEVIISPDGEATINESKLGTYIDETQLNKFVKSEIKSAIADYDIYNIIDNNIDDIVCEQVESNISKRIDEGTNLDSLIIETTNSSTLEWLNNNISHEEMLDIVKEAMIEKLKEFSFEDIKKLIDKL